MSFQDRQGRPGGGPSNRQLGWLAVVALVVVVIAVIVIVLSTTGGSSTSDQTAAAPGTGTATVATSTTSTATNTTTTAPPATTTTVATGHLSPAGGPVPSGFQPASVTAISDDVWWAMGQATCSSPPCTSIVRTADGGASWVGIPAPRTDQVSQLRFADARNGFAYGSQLWSTHDGGASWSQVTSVSGTVQNLAISGGYVYAAMGSGGLLRAAVSSDDFHQVEAGDVPSVWAQGGTVLADEQTSSGTPNLLLSSDEGSTFDAIGAPANTLQCSFATTGPPVIWAACATGTAGNVWRSSDGGAGWAQRGPSAATSSGAQSNSAPFAAASATTAVYGDSTVYRTTDGGAVWSPVSGLGGSSSDTVGYLGFTDAEHGLAIVQNNATNATSAALYATSDGGVSYTAVSIPAG